MTQLAHKPVIEPTDEFRSERWRNMIFLRDGRSCRLSDLFASERSARAAGDDMAQTFAENENGQFLLKPAGIVFRGWQFSHFIPVPEAA